MNFLLIDNFDSFTFNIVHYLEKLDVQVHVVNNLEVELVSIPFFDAVVLSPGPGLPRQAGKLMQVIETAIINQKPILGVCLGMQALAELDGSELYNQNEVKHGVSEKMLVCDENASLFDHLPTEFSVGLYHSWAIQLKDNSRFKPTAFSEHRILMAMEDSSTKIYGVQFHPESILTEYGLEIIQNFVKIVGK